VEGSAIYFWLTDPSTCGTLFSCPSYKRTNMINSFFAFIYKSMGIFVSFAETKTYNTNVLSNIFKIRGISKIK